MSRQKFEAIFTTPTTNSLVTSFLGYDFEAQRDAVRRSFIITESVWERILTLPLYPQMGEAEQDRVIDGVRTFVEERRVRFAAPQSAAGG